MQVAAALSATAVFVQGCVGIAVEPSGRKWHLRSPEQSASESQSPAHCPHPPAPHPSRPVLVYPSTKERNAVAAARRAKGEAHLRSLIFVSVYNVLTCDAASELVFFWLEQIIQAAPRPPTKLRVHQLGVCIEERSSPCSGNVGLSTLKGYLPATRKVPTTRVAIHTTDLQI